MAGANAQDVMAQGDQPTREDLAIANGLVYGFVAGGAAATSAATTAGAATPVTVCTAVTAVPTALETPPGKAALNQLAHCVGAVRRLIRGFLQPAPSQEEEPAKAEERAQAEEPAKAEGEAVEE